MFCSFSYEQEYNKSVHLLKSGCFFMRIFGGVDHEDTVFTKTISFKSKTTK